MSLSARYFTPKILCISTCKLLPLDVQTFYIPCYICMYICLLLFLESITELLLDHGAWPEARNKRNATPMMLVSDGAIAKLLTTAIENVHEKTNDGFIEVYEVSIVKG